MTFALEIMLKMFGDGMRLFFKDNWNNFDFLVVISSMLQVKGLQQFRLLKARTARRRRQIQDCPRCPIGVIDRRWHNCALADVSDAQDAAHAQGAVAATRPLARPLLLREGGRVNKTVLWSSAATKRPKWRVMMIDRLHSPSQRQDGAYPVTTSHPPTACPPPECTMESALPTPTLHLALLSRCSARCASSSGSSRCA